MSGFPAIQIAPRERGNGHVIDPSRQRTLCRRCERLHVPGACSALMEMPSLAERQAAWETITDPICRSPECRCPAHALYSRTMLDVYYDGWRQWRLTPTESALLAVLTPPWRIVVHLELLTRVWGDEYVVSDSGKGEMHLLRVNIARLRQKLGPGLDIKNVPGVGYKVALMGSPEP